MRLRPPNAEVSARCRWNGEQMLRAAFVRLRKFGLYELMDVKETAARILGRKTDIMTRDSIHKALRARIEADAVPVF